MVSFSQSVQNVLNLKDYISEGVNYTLKVQCNDTKFAQSPEWSRSLFKSNAGTVLDTDCKYKSCQLLHTWTRENIDEALPNISMKTGESLFVFSNYFSDENCAPMELVCTYQSSSWKTKLAIVNLSKLAFKNLISSQQKLFK